MRFADRTTLTGSGISLKSVLITFLSFTLLLKLITLENVVFAYAIATLFSGVLVLSYLLKTRNFLSFFLVFMHFDVLLVAVVKFFFLDLTPDSWRILLYERTSIETATFYLALLLDIYYVIAIFGCNTKRQFSVKRKFLLDNTSTISTDKASIFSFFSLLFIVIYAVVDLRFIFFGKIVYTQTASGIPFLELFQLLGYLIIFNLNALKKSTIGKINIGLYLLIALLLLVTGFRGSVVGLLLFYFCIRYLNKNIHLMRFFAVGAVILIALNVIGIFRIGTESAGMQEVLTKFGHHEENEFFTLSAIINRNIINNDNTYLMSVCRQIPGAREMLFNQNCERASVYLGESILPMDVIQSGINMGAFSLAEAVSNFGIGGGLIFTIIILSIFTYINYASYSSRFLLYISLILTAQSYTFAFYGSSNFLAMLIPSIILYVLATAIQKLTLHKTRRLNFNE